MTQCLISWYVVLPAGGANISSEICHILSGSATVVGKQGGDERTIGAGDVLVLPLGWEGEWTIHEQVRKTYVLTSAS